MAVNNQANRTCVNVETVTNTSGDNSRGFWFPVTLILTVHLLTVFNCKTSKTKSSCNFRAAGGWASVRRRKRRWAGWTRAREQGEYEPAHRARSRVQRAFDWKSVNSWRQSSVKLARDNENKTGWELTLLAFKLKECCHGSIQFRIILYIVYDILYYYEKYNFLERKTSNKCKMYWIVSLSDIQCRLC